MTFHKEGYTTIALTILLIFVVNALIQFYHPQAHAFKWVIYLLSFALFVLVGWFFRNPSVEVIANEKAILSPADGKITAIEEVEETEFLKAKYTRVTISLSLVTARVNRNPVSGVVKYVKYYPGKAFAPINNPSVTENEHTTIAIENSKGTTVLLRQVAGAPVRSITSYVKEGDNAVQGQPFGFVKFGSRVDILLPAGSLVKVAVGDAVNAGETILAEVKG